jgi:hypothetical protein
MEKAESPFHWQLAQPDGEIIYYWCAAQCLDHTGVEFPAELWDLCCRDGAMCRLIVEGGDGEPVEMSGEELVRLVDENVLTLYPAKYRARRSPT